MQSMETRGYIKTNKACLATKTRPTLGFGLVSRRDASANGNAESAQNMSLSTIFNYKVVFLSLHRSVLSSFPATELRAQNRAILV